MPTIFNDFEQVRYVIIPPGTASARSASSNEAAKNMILKDLANQGVDINDYDAVIRHFGIE